MDACSLEVESRGICFTGRELDLRKLSGPIITTNII